MGMRLPAVVLLTAALPFRALPTALATAEGPPEDLPAAVSRRTAHRRGNNAAGADAAQQDSAARTGAADLPETIATSVTRKTRASPQNRSWISLAPARSSFPSTHRRHPV